MAKQVRHLRRTTDWEKYLRFPFNTYVEGHVAKERTNDMSNWTFRGIYCRSTGNIQGTMRMFDVNTGIVKKCCNTTQFITPDTIIKKMNAWGKKSQREDLKK